MKTFDVTVTGKTPLIMHWDNIEWSDAMEEWQLDPANKKKSKKGDDRTPAWRWTGYVYHDGTHLCVPAANIGRSNMEGGASVLVPGGRSQTFKAQTQSGMMCAQPTWTLLNDGKPIRWADVEALRKLENFPEHLSAAQDLGFRLLVKRVKVGTNKHIRVRPVFDNWQISGQFSVWDEQLDEQKLRQILDYSGRYKGLCDWRPGAKTPGPNGTFEATVKQAH
jgi:hypothetical protein